MLLLQTKDTIDHLINQPFSCLIKSGLSLTLIFKNNIKIKIPFFLLMSIKVCFLFFSCCGGFG